MGVIYRVDLENTNGVVVAQFSDYLGLRLDIKLNDKGNYRLAISGFDERVNLFGDDYLVRVWMRDTDPDPVIDQGIDWINIFTGFHKTFTSSITANGQRTFTSFGPSLEELIDKEYVLYYSGSPQADKSGIVSTVMYDYIRENIGADALVTNLRDADGVVSNLVLAGDPVVGPSWEGSRARRHLLTVLKDLSAYAIGQNDDVDFRINDLGGYLFQFQAGKLGVDRTTLGLDPTTGRNGAGNIPVVFSAIRSNVTSVISSKSRYNSYNTIVALGSGEGAARLVAVAENALDANSTPVARRVRTINASNETTIDGLQAVADAKLRELEPEDKFSYVPRKVGQVLFRDYFLGDYITGEQGGQTFDKRITGIKINVTPSRNAPVDRINLSFSDLKR